jgi:Tfp pilus assembly protein PilF
MDIDALEAMIERGQDSAMLRLTLGRAYRERGEMEIAERHLRQAVTLQPGYAAAWKSLAQCQEAAGRDAEALRSYGQGLEAARDNGDMQLVKEMEVFRRRLDRRTTNDNPDSR